MLLHRFRQNFQRKTVNIFLHILNFSIRLGAKNSCLIETFLGVPTTYVLVEIIEFFFYYPLLTKGLYYQFAPCIFQVHVHIF